MANIRSQVKRNRQNERRRLRNRVVRADFRTRMKTAVADAQSGAETTDESLRIAIKKLDKAATKGVLHKRTAARRKSRLVKQINRIKAGETE